MRKVGSMSARLFDVEDKERRRLAGNLPMLVEGNVCPDCGAPAVVVRWAQLTLFRHGGYGAPQHTTLKHCAAFCGWGYTPEVIEINPRRLSA